MSREMGKTQPDHGMTIKSTRKTLFKRVLKEIDQLLDDPMLKAASELLRQVTRSDALFDNPMKQ